MAHKFKTTDIKGKAYVQVNERIKYFRTAPEYEGFALLTDWLELTDTRAIAKATICNAEAVPVATGTAYEEADSSYINKTSYIENCETSAWGRALGNLGIGIDTSIATAEEVATAIEQQDKPKPAKKKPAPAKPAPKPAESGTHPDHGTEEWKRGVASVYALAAEHGMDEDTVHGHVLEEYGKASMKELSVKQLRRIYAMIKNGEVMA